ncbi:potassium/proton antiporter [Clostridium sp. NSJ-6]|uniref:Potassium/proton antiporter n=1 Tax=Clostridium hominis TaxID=2763036 RepID=A0ABR7D8V8_9CLOT|nr:potassium/proton antiporter [Clostridium hominis]MBC5627763.1 potassium/proton antiporter [Clostridium hominis]MDU2672980.1 potassium/proton antiporter [Clostridium sp.]
MMNTMMICGLVLLISITASKVLYKFGVPILLVFIVLGMLFGSDGIVGIYFANYSLTNELCSIALVLIMFYGGFGTNWKVAKPSLKPALLMSTVGVIITTLLTGIFVSLILKVSILEGLLTGAVVASTDAASVFAILRSQKLNLKGSLASLLEVESGSNDPTAYMLTIAILTLMSSGSASGLIVIILKQVIFGILVGAILAKISVYILRNVDFEIKGFDTIFLTAIAIFAYALSEWLGGNGYLSVYLAGVIIGNSKIPHKKNLFYYFDGVSWIMQIALFFLLGLLSFPSKFNTVIGISMTISMFLVFIARPVATFLILKPFGYSRNEKLFVSWVGLRGAASLVFAIYAMTYGVKIENDIFHIIFFVALFSVAIQGTLIPILAKKLDLVDNSTTVFKTFNDYTGEMSSKLIELTIYKDSDWVNKSIMDADIPNEILIVMIKRKDEIIIPKGASIIEEGDILVLSGEGIENLESV